MVAVRKDLGNWVATKISLLTELRPARAEARLLALEKSDMLGVMAEHKLGPGRTLIDGLEVLGRGLGYYAKREHPVEKQSANPPAVDVAWKADEQQEFPLMIFEVESVAGNTMANNVVKVFGQPTEAFEKPLFFFHAVLSSGSDTSRIDTLKNHYGENNYRLYRLDHDETNSLIKDILSQHRRLNRSSNYSMIGPHFGLSRDYDEFVLGISPSLFALIAAAWGGSSGARDYIADQVEIILKAVLGVPNRVSFFMGIWLLHIAAGASNIRAYESTRSFINEHGGVSAKCLYRPRFLIGLDEESEWDEDFKEAAVLVPDRNQFIKQSLQNYPATPTASDAVSLGIDILIQPEYTIGFAERTVALLVPRTNG